MAVSSSCFVGEARRIFALSLADEMAHRNVISRAYYGLYHCALSLADTLVVPPVSACSGGSHKKVSDFYSGHFGSGREETVKYRKIGINLLRLHGQRIKADYRLSEEVYLQDAESVLISVEGLMGELVELGAAA